MGKFSKAARKTGRPPGPSSFADSGSLICWPRLRGALTDGPFRRATRQSAVSCGCVTSRPPSGAIISRSTCRSPGRARFGGQSWLPCWWLACLWPPWRTSTFRHPGKPNQPSKIFRLSRPRRVNPVPSSETRPAAHPVRASKRRPARRLLTGLVFCRSSRTDLCWARASTKEFLKPSRLRPSPSALPLVPSFCRQRQGFPNPRQRSCRFRRH